MIVPNKLLSATYARAVRKYFTDAGNILSIRDYSQVPAFPVNVYPVVYVAKAGNQPYSSVLTYEKMNRIGNDISQVSVLKKIKRDSFQHLQSENWSNAFNQSTDDFTNKLVRRTKPLEEIASVVGAATVSEAYEYKDLLIEHSTSIKHYITFINTGTIDRYDISWGRRPTRYIKNSYQKPIIPKAAWGRLSAKRLSQS